jgi:GR25 family glycosyltransferase involved in LPS biosynthesis
MKISEIPKFVLNLKHRTDRLSFIQDEMKYIGWDYEIFEAVDTGCHKGCTLSHVEIIKESQRRGYDYVMVIEDDSTIMPYSESLINILDEELKKLSYGVLNLSPTHNRPVQFFEKSKYLIDITNFPPALEHHRGVFATNMLIYHKSVFEDVIKIEDPTSLRIFPIDEFLYLNVYSKYQSYSPILPIAVQKSDFSNVTGGNYNNFLLQTYNWNLYSPYKIPNEFLDFARVQEIKKNKEKKVFIYEG